MSFRLLCTGDIHLGRGPARVPEGLDARSLGPRAAWASFVDLAINRKVDAVALAGDVVDETNRFYEAFSALQSGVERLVRDGIPVVAVSGNHDFDVLPALAEQFPTFHLLGRGGRWEETVLPQAGAPAVRIQGWSFPAAHITGNPLAAYQPPPDGLPVVGLLHCDCDAAQSRYAPVASSDLKALAPTAWLLGHVHRGRIISDGRPLVLYVGSPVGLDAGEPGRHGAWLITVQTGRPATAEFLPLAPLRWEEIDVPVDAVREEKALGPAIAQALRARHNQIRDELARTRAVGCRLRLVGRSPIHPHLPRLMETLPDELRPAFDGVSYFLERVEDHSRPDLSLEDIARSGDPAGLLAGRLLLLERRQPEEPYRQMLRDARRAVQDLRGQPVFAMLPDGGEPPDDERIRDLLLRSGVAVLEDLLAQKEAQA